MLMNVDERRWMRPKMRPPSPYAASRRSPYDAMGGDESERGLEPPDLWVMSRHTVVSQSLTRIADVPPEQRTGVALVSPVASGITTRHSVLVTIWSPAPPT